MTGLTLVVAIVTLLAGSQAATPGTVDLPEAEAPFGLATVALPADEAAVTACFEALPTTIDGAPQSAWILAADRIQVPYGEADPALGHLVVLAAISLAASDFFPPGFTPGDYVAMALATDEDGVATGGRDGDLVWVQAEVTVAAGGERPGTPEASRVMFTLTWGEVDGGWMFTAAADSPEHLEALVVAFVAAAGGEAATPAVRATPRT